jgi:predicted P-loop ATPase/GTPase
MAVVDLTRRANRLGIDISNDTLMLTEQQQIRNYIRTLAPVIKIVRNTMIILITMKKH